MNANISKIISRRGAGKVIYTGYRKYSSGGRISGISFLLLVLVVGIFVYLGNNLGEQSSSRTPAHVEKVADGDTVTVRYKNGDNATVRLIGIDTPETHHPTKPVGCFGPEAEVFTRSALDGKDVELEFDVQRYDKYGRTLAYVYLGGNRFNDELLKQGYAKVLNIEPNSKYARKYAFLQVEAKKSNVGLWGYCANEN